MTRLAKFVILQKGKEIKKFSFNRGNELRVIVGKDSTVSNITINQSFISRKHIELYKDANDLLYVRDLNSTNGTYVNSKKIPPNKYIKINIGDVITFMNNSFIQMKVLSPNESFSSRQNQKPKGSSILQKLQIKNKISIGRSKQCDVVLNTEFASRLHAFIQKDYNGNLYIIDNNSRNGTYINGRLVTGKKRISISDKIKIGNYSFSLSNVSDNIQAGSKSLHSSSLNIKNLLKRKRNIIIGRDNRADYRINDNVVSRQHARVFVENNRYFIEDLGSVNGTFVNGRRIRGKVPIRVNDEIRIGLQVIRLDGESKELSDYSSINAVNITKTFPDGYIGVKSISFSIPSKSFIALMGPSGCGKTTLMDMLSGVNPATGGKVYIHGLELESNIELLKQKIGYVPQDDIVHKDLTVNKSLYYAAKLRMNNDTTEQEIRKRIDEVCTSLNINDEKIRNNKVKSLSGGQRKRVSIAVELLNKPSILFLDEPTSPLDPETIDSFLMAMRELTEKEGTTVIMVTHKPSDLEYVDRVMFLGTKGYPAYYGSKEELFDYFNVKHKNIIKVYSKLSDEKEAERWYNKWRHSEGDQFESKSDSLGNSETKYSLIKQFYWLTLRYANIKISDIKNMLILLLQPILIPLGLVYVYSKLELSILFLMAISSIWFGVSNAAKEIVGELPIYLRERMFNLNIFTYLFSKLVVLTIIAAIQIAIFVSIIYFNYRNDEIYLAHPLQAFLFMLLLTVSATIMGLLLSSIFDNTEQVMSIIPIILIPQIIFSGVISEIDAKDKDVVSYTMLGRWGTEGLARIQNDVDKFEKSEDGKILSIFQKIPREQREFNRKQKAMIKGNDDTDENNDEDEEYTKADPLKTLGYYENDKLFNKFNSLNKNMLAIGLLDLTFFILIIISLLRKDKI